MSRKMSPNDALELATGIISMRRTYFDDTEEIKVEDVVKYLSFRINVKDIPEEYVWELVKIIKKHNQEFFDLGSKIVKENFNNP